MKIKIILVMLFLLVISACNLNRDSGDIDFVDLNTGGEGISLSTMPNAPPKEVYVGSDFSLALELHNKGVTDVSDGIVAISSCQYATVDGQHDLVESGIQLKGKTRFNPEGEIAFLDYQVQPLQEDFECLFQIETCYSYKTRADPDVCIDPDYLSLEPNKVCQVNDVSLREQGAPLTVSKVEESLLILEDSIKARFKINVKNPGNGQAAQKSALPNICGKGDFSREDLNKVHVSATITGNDLDCGDGVLEMTNEPDLNYIFCEAVLEKKSSAYMVPLSITLEYGYVSALYKKVALTDFGRRK